MRVRQFDSNKPDIEVADEVVKEVMELVVNVATKGAYWRGMGAPIDGQERVYIVSAKWMETSPESHEAFDRIVLENRSLKDRLARILKEAQP